MESVIRENGPCNVDDVSEHMPNVDRDQIIMALLSLRKTGRLEMLERGISLGYRKGSAPSLYAIPKGKL